MTDLFDASAMYDDDYLHFLAAPIGSDTGDPRSDADADLSEPLGPDGGGLDAVLSWSTAFGYFDDATNRAVLRQLRGVLRDGRARGLGFVVRLFGFPELRDWLAEAGLTGITACGEDGAPLDVRHQRMVVTATAA